MALWSGQSRRPDHDPEEAARSLHVLYGGGLDGWRVAALPLAEAGLTGWLAPPPAEPLPLVVGPRHPEPRGGDVVKHLDEVHDVDRKWLSRHRDDPALTVVHERDHLWLEVFARPDAGVLTGMALGLQAGVIAWTANRSDERSRDELARFSPRRLPPVREGMAALAVRALAVVRAADGFEAGRRPAGGLAGIGAGTVSTQELRALVRDHRWGGLGGGRRLDDAVYGLLAVAGGMAGDSFLKDVGVPWLGLATIACVRLAGDRTGVSVDRLTPRLLGGSSVVDGRRLAEHWTGLVKP
jgi:hypothetical protein